jgi:hypothetical protein
MLGEGMFSVKLLANYWPHITLASFVRGMRVKLAATPAATLDSNREACPLFALSPHQQLCCTAAWQSRDNVPIHKISLTDRQTSSWVGEDQRIPGVVCLFCPFLFLSPFYPPPDK